jgi:hypothetical protein
MEAVKDSEEYAQSETRQKLKALAPSLETPKAGTVDDRDADTLNK